MHTFPHFHLVGYAELSRDSKRKKKWAGSRWDSYSNRGSTLAKPSSIPASVVAEAQQSYIDMIVNGRLYIGAGLYEENETAKPECLHNKEA